MGGRGGISVEKPRAVFLAFHRESRFTQRFACLTAELKRHAVSMREEKTKKKKKKKKKRKSPRGTMKGLALCKLMEATGVQHAPLTPLSTSNFRKCPIHNCPSRSGGEGNAGDQIRYFNAVLFFRHVRRLSRDGFDSSVKNKADGHGGRVSRRLKEYLDNSGRGASNFHFYRIV